MIFSSISSGEFLLASAVRTPGVIVGPIAKLLGVIYNALFNLIYGLSETGSLGIAIILFTLIVKLVLSPLLIKQQKSTYKMQKLQPEMNKIKEKYAGKTDTQSQQRMAYEMQQFQKTNGISLMGGCLPLLLQLPILYALFYIFQQAYMYVDIINSNYSQLSDVILSMPVEFRMDVFTEVVLNHKVKIDMAAKGDIMALVNFLTANEWETVLSSAGDFSQKLLPLLEHKFSIEYFLGINLVSNPGISFPGIIIPLFAGVTTWLVSKIAMSKQNLDPNDPTAGTMRTMNIFMPIMMGVMTISMPAALGLYWGVGNVFQMAFQWIVGKYFEKKDERETKEKEGV